LRLQRLWPELEVLPLAANGPSAATAASTGTRSSSTSPTTSGSEIAQRRPAWVTIAARVLSASPRNSGSGRNGMPSPA